MVSRLGGTSPLPALFLVAGLFVACGSTLPAPTSSIQPRTSPALRSSAPPPTNSPIPPAAVQPTPQPEPTLRVMGLARVVSPDLRRWADPADKRANARLNRLYGRLEEGTVVLLVDGPRTINRTDYWQLWPSYWDGSSPLGWAAASRSDGDLNLHPEEPPCPPAEGLLAVHLAALADIERLSCFGDRELAVPGFVSCQYATGDGVLGGPMLNSQVFCTLDGHIALHGDAMIHLFPDLPTEMHQSGRYEVRGHFDDAGARFCHEIPFGTDMNSRKDPGDPGAVMECRTFFVATSFEPLAE